MQDAHTEIRGQGLFHRMLNIPLNRPEWALNGVFSGSMRRPSAPVAGGGGLKDRFGHIGKTANDLLLG